MDSLNGFALIMIGSTYKRIIIFLLKRTRNELDFRGKKEQFSGFFFFFFIKFILYNHKYYHKNILNQMLPSDLVKTYYFLC